MARMFYALQGAKVGSTVLTGLQSLGTSSSSDLSPVFQLGQLSTYGAYRSTDNPIEVTISKIMDGRTSIWEALGGGDLKDLYDNYITVELAFFTNIANVEAGTANITTLCGAKIGGASYSFDAEGVGTEEVTFVCDALADGGTSFNVPTVSSPSRLAVRSNIDEIDGGSPEGYTSVSCNFSLNREDKYGLGKFRAQERNVSFPIEVNWEYTSYSFGFGGDGACGASPEGDCSGEGDSGGGSTKSILLCDGTLIKSSGAFSTGSTTQGGGADGSEMTTTTSYTAWSSFYLA